MAMQTIVTQRAYTLRLKGSDPQDQSWREALWQTHEAVNKGAKAFGDWLLTLRGGLCHTLERLPDITDSEIDSEHERAKHDAKENNKSEPTREDIAKKLHVKREQENQPDAIRDRRILLALSWLSVESERGAPAEYIVAHDLDKQSGKRSNWKTVEALKEILKKRGVDDEKEIQEWEKDCRESLAAHIRDDAVWVNRSQAFEEAARSTGISLTHDAIWDMLERFLGSAGTYLEPADISDDEASGSKNEESKDLVQKAGGWLCDRFGTGKGADFGRMAKAYDAIADWASEARTEASGTEIVAALASALKEFNPKSNDLPGLLRLISGPGHKSATRNLLRQIDGQSLVTRQNLDKLKEMAIDDAEKCRKREGSKGRRPYSDTILKDVESACKFTYLTDNGAARHSEFAVMLDHAARRVSLAHTWIKRAEAARRKFEEDARRMDSVPSETRTWLDEFCVERSGASGAQDQYRIRPRALGGKTRKAWKAIVQAWAKPDCQAEEDRVEAARLIQAEWDDDEKFGDIQLFEALADDDALCVWQKDGDSAKSPDPQHLIDYVLAADAIQKRHFKVPAYRHPDALLHPVFCDFGTSRWDIGFAIHEASDGVCKAKKNVERKKNAVQKAERSVKKASGNRQKEAKAQDELKKRQADLAEAETRMAWLSNMHALSMTLWTGSMVKSEPSLLWQSKRLTHDLAFDQGKPDGKVLEVTRADRLGRAAGNVPVNVSVAIAGLFEQNDWNGRLQAPRSQLDAIAARVAKHGWDAKAKQMRNHLRWLITFSAKLQPSGPWVKYAAGVPEDAVAKPFVSRKGDYAVRHQGNDTREGHAKIVLSRLPGLRVLSVDLGHRYAAACAVWETLSPEQLKAACQAVGHEPPRDGDLYLHLKNGEQTVVYRRVGADAIEAVDEGTGKVKTISHPAPWARLDRQFLIKLQGEDREVRRAIPAEVAAVQELEKTVGRESPDRRYLRVDDLMSETVRSVRLALQRHGRRARIAFNLTASKKLLPGGREECLTDEGRAALLADTLADWYALLTGKGWTDEWAKQQWETHVVPFLQSAALPQIPEDAETTPKARRKYRADLTEKLNPTAVSLAKNESLCRKLHCLWATRWREDDAALRKRLRWLRDWILPRGRAEDNRAIRHVGGLSLTRIATIKSLYQVQKAFRMQPEPDDLRKNIPSKGDDTLRDFGRSILDVMEHMREQRVKQLASRIAEAALGIGRMKRPKGGKDPKRPRARVDEPCHAVVIENLTNYRPEETRTRRENRQLMTWSSAKVKKYLAETCQLNGLHLREISANYTSRQDSRTGAPGIRCQDVTIKEFMQSPFWRKRVAQAEKKQAEGKGDAHERFLCDMNAKWKDKPEADWERAVAVRVPLKGGEIFVSANAESPVAKGLQADLNAAANIGLKALLDPDWPGRWWYVPCDPTTFKPAKDKVAGSTAICLDKPLKSVSAVQDMDGPEKKRGKAGEKSREIVNLWRDVSSHPIDSDEGWRESRDYWGDVEKRVLDILRESVEKDSIPF